MNFRAKRSLPAVGDRDATSTDARPAAGGGWPGPCPSVPCSCGPAPEANSGRALNEETFRYLLAFERKRARRAGRALLVVFVSLSGQHPNRQSLTPRLAARIFSGLERSVRDVDFIGWFRQGTVAAAVLTQGSTGVADAGRRSVGARVTGILRERLSPEIGRQLRVRVVLLSRQFVQGVVRT